MKKVDYKALLKEMKGATVDRPNKASEGTLSGHAAGEPFEKVSISISRRIIRMPFSSNTSFSMICI